MAGREGYGLQLSRKRPINFLQIKQLPQPLSLRPAHRNLRLLSVIHSQLVARLEPRHHFANMVDVDHKAAMRAPEQRGVKQFEQFFKRAAF